MLIEKDKSLKEYNTFGIECKAKFFTTVTTLEELKEALEWAENKPHLILGGGSNILLTKNYPGLIIHLNLKGIEVVLEDDDFIHLKVMSGENWHEFVLYCLSKDYGGIENLSLIPGNVGTAPMQNIGAYGVELKDVFVSCEVFDIIDKTIKVFNKSDCKFGYRNSIFKNESKGEYVITSVTFKLSKRNHLLKTEYGDIIQELKNKNIKHPTIKDISDVVIQIRQSKLPDPKEIGNSGSFFKNPVLDVIGFKSFISKFPEAPFYKVSNTAFKVPAGWLIEQTGLKGKRFGDAGIHKNQALVLVNYGQATGAEIWELALKVQRLVKLKFDITIEPEVNII